MTDETLYPGPPFDYWSIRDLAAAEPDVSAVELGWRIANAASEAELRRLAASHVATWVDHYRREAVRKVEAASVRPAENPEPVRQPTWLERCLADPVKHWHIANHRTRQDFRKWAGDRFAAWHKAAKATAEALEATEPGSVAMFEGDWHPGGVMAYERSRRDERIRAYLKTVVDDVAAETRLEVTRELLGCVFALGDGQRVTWGEATTEQHWQRFDLLVKNAAGNVDAASRHRAAIDMIESAGVKCLADLEAVREAA